MRDIENIATIDNTDDGAKLCYIYIRDGKIARTIDFGAAPNVAIHLDLDTDGLLIGVEVIDSTGRDQV